MVMRTDSSLTSAPQGAPMKKKPAAPAPMAHHQMMGQAAAHGMINAPSHQTVMPQEHFFQSQQDYSSGVPYQGQPTPGVARGKAR